MSAAELTILTVCFGSAEWIRLNHELYRQKNPGTPATWIVVENDPGPCSGLNVPGLTTVAGPPPFPPGPFGGSLHHAAGLRAGLAAVSTRYLLILDPDLFPLGTEWAKRALDKLKAGGLAAFGTSWERSDFTKPRGFPSPHFLLLDTEKIHPAFLDFSPDPSLTTQWDPLKRGLDWFAKATGKYRAIQLARRIILQGTSHDTASRIQTRFSQVSDIRTETLPVVRKTWRSSVLDEIRWDEEIFAVHFRQVRAKHHGKPWTLEVGRECLKEALHGAFSA